MKVCHVLHSLRVGGAEMLVRRMILNAPAGLEHSVVVLDQVGTWGEELQAEGVQVLRTGRRPGVDLGLVRRVEFAPDRPSCERRRKQDQSRAGAGAGTGCRLSRELNPQRRCFGRRPAGG